MTIKNNQPPLIVIVGPTASGKTAVSIDIAKKIGTYEISIRAFNDCCSIYVPKSPVTKPMELYAVKYEQNMEYENLLKDALLNIKSMDITKDTNINISNYGFTVFEALSLYEKETMIDANNI
jgi:thiamine biosynthesis protein ThiI